MLGTLRLISRSHVISRFRPDLLPLLHKVTQMRHFSYKNSDFVTFRVPGLKTMLIFLCAKPRGPTELLKNAKNRFQVGLVCPGRWNNYRNFCLHRENELSLRNTLLCHHYEIRFIVSSHDGRLRRCSQTGRMRRWPVPFVDQLWRAFGRLPSRRRAVCIWSGCSAWSSSTDTYAVHGHGEMVCLYCHEVDMPIVLPQRI